MKINKKKALALLIATSMAFTGSACSGNKGKDYSDEKNGQETSIEGIEYEKMTVQEDYIEYQCKPETIIDEIINLAKKGEIAGEKFIDFENIVYDLEDGRVYINDLFMGIAYKNDKKYAYISETDYQKLVDKIFELDMDFINITPLYSAMKCEYGYSVVIFLPNEDIVNGNDENLYKEDFEYFTEDGITMGMSVVTEERAKELFIENLKTYMELMFGPDEISEITKTENNNIKLVLTKIES